MKEQIQQVQQFHELIGAEAVMPMHKMAFDNAAEDASATLFKAACEATRYARLLKTRMLADRNAGDSRAIRGHLVLEETSEFLDALSKGDEVAALDALCDLLYVVYGSGLVLDLPLPDGFEEVHKSNMTKRPPKGDVRASVKGDSYVRPNLAAVLAKHRGTPS